MHLRILPDHRIKFFKTIFFNVWSDEKTCSGAFAHTFRPPESSSLKRYFLMYACIGAYFQTNRNMGSKLILFKVCSGNIRVLILLRKLPDHQNQVLKKIFFNVWSGYKRVFTHLHFNVWSGKKRVLAHFRILSDHQNMGSKLMLFNVWSGNIRVLMHLRILPDH